MKQLGQSLDGTSKETLATRDWPDVAAMAREGLYSALHRVAKHSSQAA
jgi:hypothetical protein